MALKPLTKKEQEWLDQLEDILARQPKTIHLLSRHNAIAVTRPQEVTDHYAQHDSLDNCECFFTIETQIEPNGESL